jgi:hypothetical protein
VGRGRGAGVNVPVSSTRYSSRLHAQGVSGEQGVRAKPV